MSKMKAILLFTMMMVAVSSCGSGDEKAHEMSGGKQFEGWAGPPEQPNAKPPITAHGAHQPEHGGNDRGADGDPDQTMLDEIGKDEAERHAVEAVAGFDDELLVE